MIHVSPLKCTLGLFKGAGALLKQGGLLITYGAYALDGKLEPQSNVEFDKSIRARNPEYGIRDIRDLEKIALEHHIKLINISKMPANNMTLAWKKM